MSRFTTLAMVLVTLRPVSQVVPAVWSLPPLPAIVATVARTAPVVVPDVMEDRHVEFSLVLGVTVLVFSFVFGSRPPTFSTWVGPWLLFLFHP